MSGKLTWLKVKSHTYSLIHAQELNRLNMECFRPKQKTLFKLNFKLSLMQQSDTSWPRVGYKTNLYQKFKAIFTVYWTKSAKTWLKKKKNCFFKSSSIFHSKCVFLHYIGLNQLKLA